VWDETLAKSAEAWAATCIWDHGPSYLLRFLGQNLSVRTGRYRSILQLVKPWYDEVKDYAFPYPQDCNPRCPMRCYGPMCTHYTQNRLDLKVVVLLSVSETETELTAVDPTGPKSGTPGFLIIVSINFTPSFFTYRNQDVEEQMCI
ncbi:hypothetical protein CIB84_007649, partial [Bambusicola thoracicus]